MKSLALFFSLLITTLFTHCNRDPYTYALIHTDYGDMKVKLYNTTPQHRDNFVKLIKEGYYDDLLFHRVINGFMIQGGDPQSKNAPAVAHLGSGGPGYTVPAEIGRYHFKGALAAARTGGPSNPKKASSGSQFYIVQGRPVSEGQLKMMEQKKGIKYTPEDIKRYKEQGGTPFLDNDYTVFGEVIEGIEVIDKIAQVQTGEADRPVKDVKMKIELVK